MTEKVQFVHTQETLVRIDNYAMAGKALESCPQVVEVLLWNSTGDENVIDVSIGRWDTTEDLVHKSLERLCGIPEAKRHTHKLEKSEWGGYSGLRDVCGCHWDLVVGSDQVQLGENGGTM